MVIVIREEEAVDVFAKPQGEVFKNQQEGRDAFEAGEAEKVKWMDIVIISKYDIDSCYNHHVKGRFYRKRPNEKYTVIQRTSKRAVSEEEFMSDIEYFLLEIELKKGIIDFPLPEKLFLAYTYQKGQNLTPNDPRSAIIRFRGVRKIKSDQFLEFADIIVLSEQEIKEIETHINNSYKKNSRYRIKNMWIIEHTDVRTI
jgi:hypothetical protein